MFHQIVVLTIYTMETCSGGYDSCMPRLTGQTGGHSRSWNNHPSPFHLQSWTLRTDWWRPLQWLLSSLDQMPWADAAFSRSCAWCWDKCGGFWVCRALVMMCVRSCVPPSCCWSWNCQRSPGIKTPFWLWVIAGRMLLLTSKALPALSGAILPAAGGKVVIFKASPSSVYPESSVLFQGKAAML